MNTAFGDSRTVPATEMAKIIMKQLQNKDLFKEQRDVWKLGAALGISLGKTIEEGKRDTFQNINSLDDEGVFAAVILGLYPDLSPEERLKKLVDHAEWGIRELSRREKIGTLDWSKLGIIEEK
ncbi:MAG: hypothetical protein ACTSUO_04230 [Candidatus Thorarchaeota archaeon]